MRHRAPRAAAWRGAALATALLTLVACSGETQPSPEPTPEPAPGGEPTISITPPGGTTSTDVTVRAAGFPAGAHVRIGFGPPQSEYEVIRRTTAGSDGRVTATVEVPDWAETRSYLFVAVGPSGEEAISSEFRVTAGQDGRVQVTGELTDEGVECPALRADDGTLYTLAGETDRFGPGDRVEVEGTIAGTSFCMQGTTIEVENISDAG